MQNEQNQNKTPLKPVIIIGKQYGRYSNNVTQQNLLLKALQVTTDPQELKRMAGLKTVAEVYRTLDKLAMRKEYHSILAQKGFDLETIVDGIKDICVDRTNDAATRLRGYLAVLKSVGLDEYKEVEQASTKNWEDTLDEIINKKEKSNYELIEGKKKDIEVAEIVEPEEYEVHLPDAPPEEKLKQEEENAINSINLADKRL